MAGARLAVDEDAGRVRPAWADWPDQADATHVAAEWAKCVASPWYFITRYCSIYEAGEFNDTQAVAVGRRGGAWVRFELWPAQVEPLYAIREAKQVIILKARQIGMTWLVLAYFLWLVVFNEAVTVLLFSRRDTEAMDLMRRLQDMFRRLPPWLTPPGSFARGRLVGAAGHSWRLPTGSRAMAFPTSAGDSYSATAAMVDEADLVPDLDKLLASVKATVDNGGQLILLSKSNKAEPESAFKKLYRAARAGDVAFRPIFLPWFAHPRRTRKWYREQARESMARTFSMDFCYGEYPNTDEEALQANQLDKRFPALVLVTRTKTGPQLGRKPLVYRECKDVGDLNAGRRWQFDPASPILRVEPPNLPNLCLYKLPKLGRRYCIGADPAQGESGSNDSAAVMTDVETGEEVLTWWGKIRPKQFARQLAEVCEWVRLVADCRVMVERNNHGHAVILMFRELLSTVVIDASLMLGPDGAPGWNQTGATKELMYHRAAARVADGNFLLRTRRLIDQIGSVEASSLEAPEGQLDDLAVAWGLSMAAPTLTRRVGR